MYFCFSQRLQMLQAQEAALACTVDKHQQLEVSISQRLKWAAGAKPSLNQVAAQFEEILTANKAMLQVSTLGFGSLIWFFSPQRETDLCSEVASMCSAIVHLETLHCTGAETVAADNAFLAVINR